MAAPKKRQPDKLVVPVWTTVTRDTRRALEQYTRRSGFTVAGWLRALIHRGLNEST